ncbi:MAG: hypothetical protein ACLP9L_04095 [Thermoguttaceae bacterium]
MEAILQTLIVKRFGSIPAETVCFDNPTFLVGRQINELLEKVQEGFGLKK